MNAIDWIKHLPKWAVPEGTDKTLLAKELDSAIVEWSRPVVLIKPDITLEECYPMWTIITHSPDEYDRLMGNQLRHNPRLWRYADGSDNEPYRFLCRFCEYHDFSTLRSVLNVSAPCIAWSVELWLLDKGSYRALNFADMRAIRLEWLTKLKEKLDGCK